jgi:hypothetical protein
MPSANDLPTRLICLPMNSLHITPWYTVRYGYERVSRAAAEEMTIRVPEADPTNMYATVKITPETPLQKRTTKGLMQKVGVTKCNPFY